MARVNPTAQFIVALTALLGWGCGPRATILTATGSFEDVTIDDLSTKRLDDERNRLVLELGGVESSRLELVVSPPSATCWRSPDSQHACTQRAPPGVIEDGVLLRPAGQCEVLGWIENLSGAWQLDLEALPGRGCRAGRLVATVEP